MGICLLTGHERHIYTAETSESRQLDDVSATVADLKVVIAFPFAAKSAQDSSTSPPNKAPSKLVEIQLLNRDAQLIPTNPQAP